MVSRHAQTCRGGWRPRGKGNSSQRRREFSGPRRHICHHYSPGACGAWELPLSPPKLHPSSILGPVPLLDWNWLFSGNNSSPLACFSDPVFDFQFIVHQSFPSCLSLRIYMPVAWSQEPCQQISEALSGLWKLDKTSVKLTQTCTANPALDDV